MKRDHRLSVFRLYVQARIAGDVLIVHDLTDFDITVEDGPSYEVFEGHLIVILISLDCVLLSEDRTPDNFLRISKGADVRQMDNRLVIALALERFDKKGNRQSIEIDVHRFLNVDVLR